MAHLTNFSFEFFKQFSHKIALSFFYTMGQIVKNDQKLKTRRVLFPPNVSMREHW